ncbi:pullulanase X25 domain-containing protein [Arcanobacterium haemolyticum]
MVKNMGTYRNFFPHSYWPPERIRHSKAHASTQTGTMQQHLGCEANWSETCDRTQLTRDDRARTWSGTWRIPAGRHEFKLVLNVTWNNAVGNGGHGNAGKKISTSTSRTQRN